MFRLCKIPSFLSLYGVAFGFLLLFAVCVFLVIALCLPEQGALCILFHVNIFGL